MACWCISTIYNQNSLDISPRLRLELISREFWSYIVDIHREAMVYILHNNLLQGIIITLVIIEFFGRKITMAVEFVGTGIFFGLLLICVPE